MLDINGDYYGHEGSADDNDIQPLNLDKGADECRRWQIANDRADSSELLNDTVAYMRSKLSSLTVLTNDEEQLLTQKLSRSAARLALLCFSSAKGARVVVELIESALAHKLKKHMMSDQSLYFALRRELDDLVSGDANKHGLRLVAKEFKQSESIEHKLSRVCFDSLISVEWPGPFVIAASRYLYLNHKPSSTLACALREFLADRDELGAKIYSDGSEALLVKQYTREYLKYRERLVNHNLRLVFRIAKRYADRHEYFADLIQEGVVGLIRAAEKYRPSTGYRFSTYAHQWIESKVRQARVNVDKVLPVSRKYNNELLHVSQCIEKYKHLGLRLTDDVLAAETGIEAGRLKMLMLVKQYGVSMDDYSNGEESLSLHAKIPDPDVDVFGDAAKKNFADYLDRMIHKTLNEREMLIINSRFGRHNGEPKTLKDLSRIMGLSRERIRQLEIEALNKLATQLETH